MLQVTITEAKQQTLKINDNLPHKVCAYCRVSTDENDQKNSLTTQKQFFQRYFSMHKNWINVGVFADEGLSGTCLEKRNDFIRMLQIARNGGIDIILTKEVSRFSRNVQHLLNIVEEMRSLGIYIWFLSDDINTESIDYREKITQIATNAEQESLRTSRRVKWGQQQQMESGVVFGRKKMYGYNITKDDNGIQHFEIIPEEAKIIKQIFEWFSCGEGTHLIGTRLEQMGVETKKFSYGWTGTVILRILRNEKYVGDLLQGKTYTPDPLTHKKKYNHGESQKVYIRDHHPESAIIPRDLWDKVQNIFKENETTKKVKAKYSNKYWASGKVYCALCGQRYVSCVKQQLSGTYHAWVCIENHRRGKVKQIKLNNGENINVGCNALRVNNKVLKTALRDIVTNYILKIKEKLINEICEEYGTVSQQIRTSKRITSLEKSISSKQDELVFLTQEFMNGTIPKNAFTVTIDRTVNELDSLRKQLNNLQVKRDEENETTISKNVKTMITEILSFSSEDLVEDFYERITKQIVVYPQNILELHFSFIPVPIYVQYRTSGKKDNYKVELKILTTEQFRGILNPVQMKL